MGPVPAIILAQSASAALGNVARDLDQAANRINPIALPSPAELMAAWQRGFIGKEDMSFAMLSHGVPWGNDGAVPGKWPLRQRAWYAAYRLGWNIPGPAECLSAVNRGIIPKRELDIRLKESGGHGPLWKEFSDAAREWLTPADLVDLVNRGAISEDEYHAYLKLQGGWHPDQLKLFDTIRKKLPGISDLSRYAVREVFNPQIAADHALYNEYQPELAKWAKTLGYGWDLGFQVPTEGGDVNATWGMVDWAAHWQSISPGMVYQMFQRLRAGRIQRYKDRGLNVNEFTLADVNRWLRVNDYPPKIRDYLVAISYAMPQLRQINSALQYGGKDESWALEQFLDRGLHPDDAKTQARIAEVKADEWRNRFLWRAQTSYSHRLLHRIESGVDQPADVRGEVSEALTPQGVTVDAIEVMIDERTSAKDEADKLEVIREQKAWEKLARRRLVRRSLSMFEVGLLGQNDLRAALQALNLTAKAVDGFVTESQGSAHEAVVRSAVNRIKADYLEGAITDAGARDALQSAGIQQQQTADYIQVWGLDFDRDRRAASTANVVKWYRERLLDRGGALTRLHNVGWSDPDIELLLQDADLAADQALARAAAAQGKQKAQQAKAAEKSLAGLGKATKALQSQLKKLTPLVTLKVWLGKNIISELFFRKRMAYMGFPPADIEANFEEVVKGMTADQKAAMQSITSEESPADELREEIAASGGSSFDIGPNVTGVSPPAGPINPASGAGGEATNPS